VDRRPIASRDTRWAHASARWLQAQGATPNGISMASIFCSLLAAMCLYCGMHASIWQGRVLLLIAALLIVARLVCNLLDGLVAVEGGMQSPGGAVYNDLPDRISDAVTLLGVGYSISAWPWAVDLGWAAALLAVMTAYVRVLGGACGLPQRFSGPFAKQQRMVVIIFAAIMCVGLPVPWQQWTMLGALVLVTLGSALTVVLRTRAILHDLAAK